MDPKILTAIIVVIVAVLAVVAVVLVTRKRKTEHLKQKFG
jgi:multisubunit Na+/H+ antiporter MnhC subunit